MGWLMSENDNHPQEWAPSVEDVLTNAGFESVADTIRALDDLEDEYFDRSNIAHTLWTMGGSIKHKKCSVDNEASYENTCRVCETYLLAVAESLILIRRLVAHDAEVRAEAWDAAEDAVGGWYSDNSNGRERQYPVNPHRSLSPSTPNPETEGQA